MWCNQNCRPVQVTSIGYLLDFSWEILGITQGLSSFSPWFRKRGLSPVFSDTDNGTRSWLFRMAMNLMKCYKKLSRQSKYDLSIANEVMSRRYIFPSVVKVLCLTLALSGCFLGSMEQRVFIYELRIENQLATPIAHCEAFEAATCPNVVQSGASERVTFDTHVDYEGDEMLKVFDREKIKVCGKLLDMTLVRSVSPIVKREKNYFEIIIDKAISDKFCQ
ncbi:hypothetical protein [Pseudomonas sp. St316]|uniref:hypothetical protein n=1 Tax=Pseudomonas sp. St316 TaxID=2678257 RepID=UPI001BB42138|nr:hypothetical protein [Pseudomonas sp. St316]BBP59832.1 hypothetical protein PHLH4_34220 [Pseudomonas sp. St316]